MAEEHAGGPYLMPEPDNDRGWTPYRPDPARTAAILASAAAWYRASLEAEHTPGLDPGDRAWVRDMLRPSTER